MLVNENRLNLADMRARKYLLTQMEKYFFGEGADPPPGYVPPTDVIAARKRLARRRCLSRRALRANPAVLTKPAQNRAKALFCSNAPAWLRSSGDDSEGSAAAPNACAGSTLFHWGEGKHLGRGNVATAAAGAAAPPLSRRPRSGAGRGR